MATRDLPALGGHPEGFAGSMRTDRWWIEPVLTVLVLGAFGVYATWAAFQGNHYYADPYLSPFYSPLIFVDSAAAVPGGAPEHHAWFGGHWPAWWPAFLPHSPAFFILAFPGAFRFTCYYYRKAYYRAFTGSPPGCAVVPTAKSRRYKGETAWLLFQNLHRYAMFFAVLFIPILGYDALLSFWKGGLPWDGGQFGIGVGSLVLTINVILLGGYTFGCHSFRHLIGGKDDCMSCGKATMRLKLWKRVTILNMKHQNFAWFSLFWVGFTDVYVRLVSQGIWTDLNTWG
ncbi:MAG: hypothetical protein DHS20C21_11690 [Gemmatimonadota bacterium]|nr:MAG: hypothetical protein DHS20C21_11690 [Gemmatimonadota bacterium]